MKKIVTTSITRHLLLGSALMLVASSLPALGEFQEKTFLMPRSIGTNKAMEMAGWHELIYGMHNPDHADNRSHVQVAPFYQHSVSSAELGKYFGVGNGSNTFTVGDTTATGLIPVDLFGALLIHNNTGTPAAAAAGTVTFAPKQEVYGTRLDYLQLFKFKKHSLFFKASMPVVYVSNDMGMTITGANTVTVGSTSWTLADFFAGRVNVSATQSPEDQQSPLTAAKINGRRSKTGVADLDLSVGFRWSHEEDRYLALSGLVTVPTGNRPHGEYLFEPIYGNGHHVALGANVDAGAKLWDHKHASISLHGGMQYRYLFEATEVRTASVQGIVNDGGPLVKLAHYALAAKNGQQNQPLFPLANVLTRDMRVKPGSQLEGLLDLSFQNKHFVIDLGYNMFWKDQESAWLKKGLEEGIYGVAKNNYDATELFNSTNPAQKPLVALLSNKFINGDTAKTPAPFTHKVFGSVGYKCSCESVSSFLGLGGSYEFVDSNAAIENYALWAKLCLSF